MFNINPPIYNHSYKSPPLGADLFRGKFRHAADLLQISPLTV